jgi:nitrogen regulatory protein PII
MKTITILAEHLSDRALKAALPAEGLVSVIVSDAQSSATQRRAVREVHSFRNPARFSPRIRMQLVVHDDAVETVFDSLSFAHGAGFFSDAEAWMDEPANALVA